MKPNKRDLRAFVRVDYQGRIVPSSLILRKNKPKIGKWYEAPAYECCSPIVIDPCVTYSITVDSGTSGDLYYTDCNGEKVGPVTLTGPT